MLNNGVPLKSLGRSWSLKMAPFDRSQSHTSFYLSSIATMAQSRVVSEIKREIGGTRDFFNPPLHNNFLEKQSRFFSQPSHNPAMSGLA